MYLGNDRATTLFKLFSIEGMFEKSLRLGSEEDPFGAEVFEDREADQEGQCFPTEEVCPQGIESL